jgi:hypothetical protein
MGVTIQFESHRVELAFVYEMEHDSEVLEYYDQAPSILLDYESANERHLAVMHTPDYFVIHRDSAGWQECKHERELEKLAQKSPNRYCRNGDGHWRCPPGEAHATRFGLYYRLRSSAEIDWTLQRNIQYLDDYWRFDAVGVASETTNTRFTHNLQGNTQITRNVRQVTKSVDPRELAAWTLAELHTRLSEYLFEVYDTIEHPALGRSPREAFQAGLEASGTRTERMIPYDQEFLMVTLPATPKGTAKVTPGRGVKINRIYYWSGSFQSPVVENQQVPIRYDPFDAGTAYAFVERRWVRCHSEYYTVLHGHSEKEIMVASNELRRRQQSHSQGLVITAKKLAGFLAISRGR